MIDKVQTLCPRCEQGFVVTARVKKTGAVIYLCNECEAVWFCPESIDYATFNYFNYLWNASGCLIAGLNWNTITRQLHLTTNPLKF